MTIESLPYSADSPPKTIFESLDRGAIANCERELTKYNTTETQLREALAREQTLLRQKNELIKRHAILSKESDHRLLNGVQMIVSLLSLQSRASANAEVASQLAVAANRVATIARVHRRLHCFDNAKTVAFTQYLKDFCRDFSPMLFSEQGREQVIVVEGPEITLPIITSIPLAFIVNELITNAAKYGRGRITVRLEPNPGKGYTASVSNDGPILLENFDPAACKGLGMRIIRALVARIGGELRVGQGDNNRGTKFTVLFS
jgi:two-component system, sensor histidine kinase PdtaS